MDHIIPSFPSILPSLLGLLLFFLFILKTLTKKPSPNYLPPGPLKLPIIGSIYCLFDGSMVHESLAKLAKKYGPLFHLKCGELSFVIVTSVDVAKQVYRTHDLVCSSRPLLPSQAIITHNATNIETAPYGEYWRQLRKVAIVELLSVKRVKSFEPIRDMVFSRMVQGIASAAAGGSPVNLSHFLFMSISEIVSRAAFGEEGKYKEEFVRVSKEAGQLFSGYSLADFFPSKKFLMVLTGLKYRCEKSIQKLDRVLDAIIKEHLERERERKPTSNNTDHKPEIKNLLQVLLDIHKNGGLPFPLTLDNIKSILPDIYGAGSESSSSTVEWAMSLMLRDQTILEKAQAEVRSVFRNKGKVDDKGIEELKYMKAVIKETLRLHPPPLNLRETTADCELNGYHIPSKSILFVNHWALGRDPNYWNEPNRFLPERFLVSSVDFRGSHFQFIPFGAGRRICPGLAFGVANTERLLAEVLYHFDWKLPEGMKPHDIDMEGAAGFVVLKKQRLLLTPIPYVG